MTHPIFSLDSCFSFNTDERNNSSFCEILCESIARLEASSAARASIFKLNRHTLAFQMNWVSHIHTWPETLPIYQRYFSAPVDSALPSDPRLKHAGPDCIARANHIKKQQQYSPRSVFQPCPRPLLVQQPSFAVLPMIVCNPVNEVSETQTSLFVAFGWIQSGS